MKVVHFLQERATLVLMTMKTNFSMMTIWKMAAGKDGTTALRLTVLMTVIMTSKLTKESLYIVWRQIKTLRETQSSYHFAFTCCSRHSRRYWSFLRQTLYLWNFQRTGKKRCACVIIPELWSDESEGLRLDYFGDSLNFSCHTRVIGRWLNIFSPNQCGARNLPSYLSYYLCTRPFRLDIDDLNGI